MSFFSDKLRELVASSGVSVAQIADRSGVSTAMLYKIQNGTRLPDSTETLDRILDAIHCSLPQKHMMCQEYLICRIGVHRYNSFSQLKAMLSAFVTPVQTAPPLHYAEDLVPPSTITGENNVNTVIQQLLDQEIRRPGGNIQMFLDLKFRHCFTYLAQSLTHCPVDFGSVTHLFCLKATAAPEATLHNISVLRDVLPQMAALPHYDPMYCYLPEPNDGTVPFPYYIITNAGVLLMNSSLNKAVFLSDPGIRCQFYHQFMDLAKRFSPCMQAGSASMETYFQGFHQIVGRHDPSQIRPVIMGALPCMLPCVDPYRAMSYLPQEFLADPDIQKIAEEYFAGAAIGGYETFYTLSGLERLIRTGEIMELQGDFVPRARQEDVLDGLEEMVRRAKAGIVVPHIFKTPLIPEDSHFTMTLRGDALMLYCESSCRNAVYTTLAENTMASVVKDYVEHAELLGDLYSVEESIALTENILRKYRTQN